MSIIINLLENYVNYHINKKSMNKKSMLAIEKVATMKNVNYYFKFYIWYFFMRIVLRSIISHRDKLIRSSPSVVSHYKFSFSKPPSGIFE